MEPNKEDLALIIAQDIKNIFSDISRKGHNFTPGDFANALESFEKSKLITLQIEYIAKFLQKVLYLHRGKNESDLGNFLRRKRTQEGKTLKQVEDISGLSNAHLSQIETGKITRPRTTILEKISKGYDIEIEKLRELTGTIDSS